MNSSKDYQDEYLTGRDIEFIENTYLKINKLIKNKEHDLINKKQSKRIDKHSDSIRQ